MIDGGPKLGTASRPSSSTGLVGVERPEAADPARAEGAQAWWLESERSRVGEAAAGQPDGEALQLQAGVGEGARELGLRRRRARRARRRSRR